MLPARVGRYARKSLPLCGREALGVAIISILSRADSHATPAVVIVVQSVCYHAPHSKQGVVFLDWPLEQPGEPLDADTRVCKESFAASMAGGGAVLQGLDILARDEERVVYVVARNPGEAAS